MLYDKKNTLLLCSYESFPMQIQMQFGLLVLIPLVSWPVTVAGICLDGSCRQQAFEEENPTYLIHGHELFLTSGW